MTAVIYHMLSHLHETQPSLAFVRSCLPFSHTPNLSKINSVYRHPFWLLSNNLRVPRHTYPSSPGRRQYSLSVYTEDVMMRSTVANAVVFLQWSLRHWGLICAPAASIVVTNILPCPSATRNGMAISSSDGHT